jgi:hypothetical protein
MSIESALQTLLANLCSGRCYPLINTDPVIVCPYITFQVITGSPILAVASSNNPENVDVQIDIFGKTYASAHTLAQSVKTAMLASSLQNAQTMYQDLWEEVSKEYRVMLEYSIWK